MGTCACKCACDHVTKHGSNLCAVCVQWSWRGSKLHGFQPKQPKSFIDLVADTHSILAARRGEPFPLAEDGVC